MAAALSRRHSLSVITVYGPTGSPADASTTFITCLSIITADAVTPDPTYRTSARSSRPWIVPSSPNGPCSSGKTTSTSPRVRGGWPASCTTRVRSVALVGTMTLAASVSTSGTWPAARRSACGVVGREHPAAVLGDADGHDVVAVAVERLEHARRRWRTTPRARRTGRRRPGPRGCAARRRRRGSVRGWFSSVLIARDSIRWPRPARAGGARTRRHRAGHRLR